MARTSNTSQSTKKEGVSKNENSDFKIPLKRNPTSLFMQTMQNNLSKRTNQEENSMNSSNSSKKKARIEPKSNRHSIDPTVLLQFKKSSQNTNTFDDSKEQVEKLGSHLLHYNTMSKYIRESTVPSVRSRTYNNIINNNISTSADRTKRYPINRPSSTYINVVNSSISRQRTEFVPHVTSFKNTRKNYHGYHQPSINTSPNEYDPNINSQHGYDQSINAPPGYESSISAPTGYHKPSIHALPGYDSSSLARTGYRKPSIYAQPGYQSSISARTGYRKPSIHEPAGYQNPFVSDVARSSRSLSELKGHGTPRNSHHFTTKGSSGVENLSPQDYEKYCKYFQSLDGPNEHKNTSRVHKYTSLKYRKKSPSLHGIKYGNRENQRKALSSKKYYSIYQWNPLYKLNEEEPRICFANLFEKCIFEML